MKRTSILWFLCPPCLFFLLSFSPVMASHTGSMGPEAKTEETGAATCKDCHEKEYESYAKSIHSKKAVKGPGGQDACESCHGPGATHVEKGGGRGVDIFAFNKDVDPKARSARCLVCHEETCQLTHWKMSKHSDDDLSCDDCHSPHNQNRKFLREDQ